MGRAQTLTVTADKAELKSRGGLQGKMKKTGPDQYRADDWNMGNVQLTLEADLSKEPKTFLASDRTIGCRWTGQLKP